MSAASFWDGRVAVSRRSVWRLRMHNVLRRQRRAGGGAANGRWGAEDEQVGRAGSAQWALHPRRREAQWMDACLLWLAAPSCSTACSIAEVEATAGAGWQTERGGRRAWPRKGKPDEQRRGGAVKARSGQGPRGERERHTHAARRDRDGDSTQTRARGRVKFRQARAAKGRRAVGDEHWAHREGEEADASSERRHGWHGDGLAALSLTRGSLGA